MSQLQFDVFRRVRFAIDADQVYVWLLDPATGEPVSPRHFSFPLSPRRSRHRLHLTDETKGRKDPKRHPWWRKVAARALRGKLQALGDAYGQKFWAASVCVDESGSRLAADGWRLIAPTPAEVRAIVQPALTRTEVARRVSFEPEVCAGIERALLGLATEPPAHLPSLWASWETQGGGGALAPIFLVRDLEEGTEWEYLLRLRAEDGRANLRRTPFTWNPYPEDPQGALREMIGTAGAKVASHVGQYLLRGRKIDQTDAPPPCLTEAASQVSSFLVDVFLELERGAASESHPS